MSNQITTLGNQEETLSEQYDAANVTLGKDRKAVTAAGKAVAAADASTAKAKKVLTSEAVNAYMQGGTAGVSAAGDNTLKNANTGLLRIEYASSLAATQTDAIDAFHLATLQAQTAKTNLEAAQSSAQQQMSALAADRQSVIASQNKLEGVYHQETGQIATLVAQIQAQQQQEAAQAQEARTAAANAASSTSTSQPGVRAEAQVTPGTSATTNASPTGTTAAASPPASGVGAAAVAAAETQLGVPYVWGGDTPGVGFDCSGLVMWAYAQVGISLPHFSGGQFAAGVQIPMSDLEPGDLVFFANPGDHVAMYVGGGNIIEAPDTGQVVHIVPMYSEFVQAVRIS